MRGGHQPTDAPTTKPGGYDDSGGERCGGAPPKAAAPNATATTTRGADATPPCVRDPATQVRPHTTLLPVSRPWANGHRRRLWVPLKGHSAQLCQVVWFPDVVDDVRKQPLGHAEVFGWRVLSARTGSFLPLVARVSVRRVPGGSHELGVVTMQWARAP